MTNQNDVAGMISKLSARLARMEDIAEIELLKARYVQCCDDGYDENEFSSLFTEGGKWVGPEGSYHGKDAIRDFIASVKHELKWTCHYLIRPVVDVSDDGLTAKGTWYALIVQSVLNEAAEAGTTDMVNFARYVDEFEKVDGQWLLSRAEPIPSRSWDMAGEWIKK